MGGDVWFTGDGKLKTVSVELGEDDRSNRCNFSLYDKGNEIGAKYFKISFEQGGIEVPDDLLQAPEQNAAGGAVTSSSAGGSGAGGSANTTLSPNVRAFLDMIAYAEGTSGPDGYRTMFTGRLFNDFSRHPDQAITSGGLTSTAAGRYQFLTTTWNEVKAKLGLTDFSPESQDLACVELIRRRGALEMVEAGNIAGAINRCRMEWASLPGSPYGQPVKTMSELLNVYEQALRRYQGQATQPAAAAEAQDKATESTPPKIEDVATTKPKEVSEKGTEIIVEMGYEIAQMVAFHFIHTGSTATALSDRSVSFEGQGIRFLINRRYQNTSYQEITLKELATIICSRYRLQLDMEGDGPTFDFLDQTGISDYELLRRECRAIGWRITEDGRKLILRPVIANFTGFVIDETLAAQFQFNDRASTDRIMPPPEGLTAQSVPSSVAGQRKSTVDPQSGRVENEKPEDSTGTGDGSGVSSTGAANAPVSGTTQNRGTPGGEGQAIREGRSAEQGVGQNPSSVQATTSREVTTAAPNSLIAANDLDDSNAAMTARIRAGRLREEQEKKKAEKAEGGGGASSSTGSAQAANFEIARGYESSCTFKTVPAALKLKPGDIIAISRSVLPEPFAREWRVSRVTHTAQGGTLTTTLNIYSPVAVTKKENSATPEATSAGGIVSNAPTGKLQNPMPGALRGTPS
ncbi:hypothetical protein [Thermoleptolyngbya sp.]